VSSDQGSNEPDDGGQNHAVDPMIATLTSELSRALRPPPVDMLRRLSECAGTLACADGRRRVHQRRRGLESTAVTLSAVRAAMVQAWFVANGIPAARIATHGWGDSHPIYPRLATDAERAANRRCEITVTVGTP
jgi:hypothetical protein